MVAHRGGVVAVWWLIEEVLWLCGGSYRGVVVAHIGDVVAHRGGVVAHTEELWWLT